jgi:hypothetical protein
MVGIVLGFDSSVQVRSYRSFSPSRFEAIGVRKVSTARKLVEEEGRRRELN